MAPGEVVTRSGRGLLVYADREPVDHRPARIAWKKPKLEPAAWQG